MRLDFHTIPSQNHRSCFHLKIRASLVGLMDRMVVRKEGLMDRMVVRREGLMADRMVVQREGRLVDHSVGLMEAPKVGLMEVPKMGLMEGH